MINRIELQILNPDGSKFIESPIVISEEQLKELEKGMRIYFEAQFKKGNIFKFGVTGNTLQGEVINCEMKAACPVLDAGESSALQVTIKIKPQSPQIIPLTASGQ